MEDNIKINFKAVVYECIDWTHLIGQIPMTGCYDI
jgi:hypothetical protein